MQISIAYVHPIEFPEKGDQESGVSFQCGSTIRELLHFFEDINSPIQMVSSAVIADDGIEQRERTRAGTGHYLINESIKAIEPLAIEGDCNDGLIGAVGMLVIPLLGCPTEDVEG